LRSAELLLLVALSGLIACPARASCPSEWLNIVEQANDGQVILSARNPSQVPITFTMDIDYQRLTPSREPTFTETLAPGESRAVISLQRRNENREGRYWYTTKCSIGNKNADHDDSVIYLMPYETGKSYRVLQGYGSSFSHKGLETYAVDFNMREGTPVRAARAGIVADVEESHSRGCWEDGCGRFANYIVIVHEDETTGEYYHLQKNGALVEPGDYVTAGQQIGLSGNTGHTTMPHLHFGVYRADDWGREQSIPVRFITADGIVDRPRSGGRYFATSPGRVSRNADAVSSGKGRILK